MNLQSIIYSNVSAALLSRGLIFDASTLRSYIAHYSTRQSEQMVNIIANILLSVLGSQWRLVDIDGLSESLAATVNRERLGF